MDDEYSKKINCTKQQGVGVINAIFEVHAEGLRLDNIKCFCTIDSAEVQCKLDLH